MKLTYLFIAHDLSMVKHISNRVVVMYLGAIVEITTSDELYKEPLHPYTQALLSAIPIPDPIAGKKRKRIMLEGDVPSPVNTVTGCKFISRCKHASEKCKEQNLKLKEVSPGHFVACSLY
jgi:oligopeptide transport system ATP-binding protein